MLEIDYNMITIKCCGLRLDIYPLGAFLGAVAICALLCLGACSNNSSEPYPTESVAAARREFLKRVPVQTEGIIPTPPEAQEEPEAISSSLCPHCGKSIEIRVRKK
jgi:hypothetical protein